MIAETLAAVRAFLGDRTAAITAGSICLALPTFWFMGRCIMWHRKRRKPWDTGAFGLSVAGAVAAVWFMLEAMFNVGTPPPHWRIYVVVLSFALLHHSIVKAIDLWASTAKPPAARPENQASAR